jgi:hypothetical protein
MIKEMKMKKILFILTIIFSSNLLANSYYALLEPIETYNIKSSVRGQVIYVNRDIEGRVANDDMIINIDDKIDKEELKYLNDKIDIVMDMFKIEQNNYNTIKKLSTKSKFEKDSAKIKILNIKSTLNDLKTKKMFLEDKIKNKTIKSKGNFIYKIIVNNGDYVNLGSPLMTAKNISQGKLTVYLPLDEAQKIKSRVIFIDDKKSNLNISKIYAIADEQKVSSYKCEIIINKPMQLSSFSKLIKIDFKEIKKKNDETY